MLLYNESSLALPHPIESSTQGVGLHVLKAKLCDLGYFSVSLAMAGVSRAESVDKERDSELAGADSIGFAVDDFKSI